MFKIFRINLIFSGIIRAISILLILFRYFFVSWLSKRKITSGLVRKKYKHNGVVKSAPERMRATIEELGPTFVKFGQILADRPDMISDKLRNELKKLQSRAKPFDHDLAIDLIEIELGGPIEKFFEEFDRECIGSASIGQVYKARLHGGEEVIVKIQRPNIKNKIKTDLQLLKFIAQQLVKEYPGLKAVDVVGFVEEFGNTIMLELDYLYEAANATHFADIFRNVPYCKIPRVHLELSTKTLLIMEYVDGIPPDRVQELVDNGLEPKMVAQNGTHIFLKMIFEHGFFHADPHAGNMFIQDGNRVALIDYGMVGTLKPSDMEFLAKFTLGMATKSPRIISEALLKLCGKKFFQQKEEFEFAVSNMMMRYGSMPYERINFSQMLNECVKIILKYELRVPGSIYLLVKALATIEKLGYNLDPEISLPNIIKPYAKALIRKEYSPSAIAHAIFDTARDYVTLVRTFPSEISEILYKVKEGKLIHDIQLNDQGFVRSLRQMTRTLAIAFLIGFMLTGSIIINIWGDANWVSDFMFVLSSFFAIWLLLGLFFKTKM